MRTGFLKEKNDATRPKKFCRQRSVIGRDHSGSALTKDERLYFDHVARCNHHLKPIDVPMLMLYAASVVRAMKARHQDDETFEKEARAALALARSLRLTPQSTSQAITAARRRAEAGSISYYDRMNLEEEH